jgi:hypothetical protein
MTNNAARWAAATTAAYATLALAWTVTGRGFPFGPADEGHDASPLRALPAAVGAPLFAVVLLLAAVAALTMSGSGSPRRPVRAGLLAYCWTVIAALLVVVPDVRLLTILGYLPIIVVGAPFGWPPVDYAEVFTWALANQAIGVVLGLLLARATLRWQFRTAGACERCGRREPESGWTTPAAAARWGRWATDVPLGISADFLAELRHTGLVWAGAGLGGLALAGVILTLGLVQRWGEIFPRWMIGLAGRRVPIKLATVPATLVAVFVTSASVGFFTADGFLTMFTGEFSLATAPMLLWPLWGAALGAATLAYHLRRRDACAECGRGRRARGLVPAGNAEAY